MTTNNDRIWHYWGVSLEERDVGNSVENLEVGTFYPVYHSEFIFPHISWENSADYHLEKRLISEFVTYISKNRPDEIIDDPSGSFHGWKKSEATSKCRETEDCLYKYLEYNTKRLHLKHLQNCRVSPEIIADVKNIKETAVTRPFGTVVLSSIPSTLRIKFYPNAESITPVEQQSSNVVSLYQNVKKISEGGLQMTLAEFWKSLNPGYKNLEVNTATASVTDYLDERIKEFMHKKG